MSPRADSARMEKAHVRERGVEGICPLGAFSLNEVGLQRSVTRPVGDLHA
jgi:hypothetical protein